MTMTRRRRGLLSVALAVVACVVPEAAFGQTLDRHSYVAFPQAANELLLEEVATIGAPLPLEVVTNVAYPKESNELWQLFKAVVRRMHNQNQIVHVSPHYYITSGVKNGCRVLQWDQATNKEVDLEVVPVPPQCVNSCTNHGRYCVIPAPEEEGAFPETVPRGKHLMEETLRRICFIELYHGSDLRFWEYMEYFDSYGCHNATDMKSCSLRVLDAVPRVDYRAIDNCMHQAGGLEEDRINLHLQVHLERQIKVHYTSANVPLVHFGGEPYSGEHQTALVLEWMCSIFSKQKGVTPIACTFCGNCVEVEQCLWYLNCDGTAFTTEAFMSTGGTPEVQLTPISEPATTTTPPAATTPESSEPAVEAEPAETSSEQESAGVEAGYSDEYASLGWTDVSASSPVSSPVATPTTATSAPEEEEHETAAAVIGDASPNDLGPGDTFIAFTHAPSSKSPTASPTAKATTNSNSTYEVSTTTEETPKEHYKHTTKSHGHNLYKQDSPEDYILPIIIAFSLLACYGCTSYCYKRYKHRKKTERQRAAEAYFDDLMEASYADNLAVSGRIEDDVSDRDFEDVGLDESYRYPDENDFSNSIRRRKDSSSDDEDQEASIARLSANREPKKPPPFYSFKVHQVMG